MAFKIFYVQEEDFVTIYLIFYTEKSNAKHSYGHILLNMKYNTSINIFSNSLIKFCTLPYKLKKLTV